MSQLTLEEKIENMRNRTFNPDCIPTANMGFCPAGIPGSDHEFCNAPLGKAKRVEIKTTSGHYIDVMVCPKCHSKVLPAW